MMFNAHFIASKGHGEDMNLSLSLLRFYDANLSQYLKKGITTVTGSRAINFVTKLKNC